MNTESSTSSMLHQRINSFERTLDKSLGKQKIFLQLEQKTGIKKTRLVAIVTGVFLGLGLLWLFGDVAFALLSFVYPAIMTIGAIENPNKDKTVHCLTYWLAISGLWTAEMMTGYTLRVLPLWFYVKSAVVVWWMGPWQGSVMTYKLAIHPIANQLVSHPLVKEVSETANNLLKTAKYEGNKISEKIKKQSSEPINKDLAKEEPVKSAADKKDE